MPSEWKIWDYFRQNRTRKLDAEKNHSYYCFSDVVTGILVSNIKQNNEARFSILNFDEINIPWIENELLTPSLFSALSEETIYVVYDAQKIKPEARNLLWQYNPTSGMPRFVLLFSELDKAWNELLKSGIYFESTTLLAPKFFEMDQLLTFMAQEEGMAFDIDGQTAFLELVEHRALNFSRELNILKGIVPRGELIREALVRKHINPGRIDTFSLAAKLAQKQYSLFFKELSGGTQDREHLEEFFRFLIGHFLKLLDPSYADKKARPTKYDKEIKLLGSRWKEQEISEILQYIYTSLLHIRQGQNMQQKFTQAYLATLR